MAELPHFTGKNFEKEIAKGNWVIDFWAEWCPPCKMMGPHFAEAASKSKISKFGKVDIEEEQELAAKFDVMSIPTLIYFKNGKEVGRSVGLVDSKTIISKENEFFK